MREYLHNCVSKQSNQPLCAGSFTGVGTVWSRRSTDIRPRDECAGVRTYRRKHRLRIVAPGKPLPEDEVFVGWISLRNNLRLRLGQEFWMFNRRCDG
jgi:hypothetical protein